MGEVLKVEKIFKSIKIVPLNNILVHEQTVKKWARHLAYYMADTGIQKNPIVVCKINKKYIVLDGMHRVEAMKFLKCRDIMVYIVDYFNDNVELHNWYAIAFGKIKIEKLIKEVNNNKYKNELDITKLKKRLNLNELIKTRKILVALRDKEENIYIISPKKEIDSNAYINITTSLIETIESAIDAMECRLVYVPDTTGENDFKISSGSILIYRPLYKKEEIINWTLAGNTFPRKSTRHIIPGRPLRVDINITLLKENIDLKTKNKLLKAHLLWCFESNKMRFYPEPVYVFSD